MALLLVAFAPGTALAQLSTTHSDTSGTTHVTQSATPQWQSTRKLDHVDPASAGLDPVRLVAGIDRAFADAMEDNQLSGGVCLVLKDGGIVFEKAYGYRSIEPTTETTTLDTIYDLASLTKPVATASAIMKLVEQGRVRVADRVRTHIPEWKNTAEVDEQTSEVARLKRYIRAGTLLPAKGMLEVTDMLTTETPGGAPVQQSPSALWAKLMGEKRVRVSEEALDKLVELHPFSKSDVTLRHLLTHTAGLDPFERYYLRWPERGARDRIIADIASRKLAAPPREKFIYSDLGFITLGEIVERATSMTLAEFTKNEIFGPLGMKDTMFTPPAEMRGRIAPTEWRSDGTTRTAADGTGTTDTRKTMVRGEVHDGNAFVQDGISGHAGLFSTASDLAIFCQMLLNGGEYGGTRIFSPLTVAAMTRDQAQLKSGEQRGLGWDVSTGYSGQRGDLFESGYGHTGWTGTSLWLVPEHNVAIILLTNRVHPNGTGDAGPLRGKVANVVAGSLVR